MIESVSVWNRWSAKTGSGPSGDVEIHQYLGEAFYKGPVSLGFSALFDES